MSALNIDIKFVTFSEKNPVQFHCDGNKIWEGTFSEFRDFADFISDFADSDIFYSAQVNYNECLDEELERVREKNRAFRYETIRQDNPNLR